MTEKVLNVLPSVITVVETLGGAWITAWAQRESRRSVNLPTSRAIACFVLSCPLRQRLMADLDLVVGYARSVRFVRRRRWQSPWY